MNGKSISKKLIIFSLTLLFTHIYLSAKINDQIQVQVITEPKANILEQPGQNVQLKEVGSIPEEVAPNQFLFKPFSFTYDSEGSWYIYDILQAKIFKFDQQLKFMWCVGSIGIGPGEFSGTGKAHPVYIEIGQDGYLYANDVHAKKVLAFQMNGKFLKNIPYTRGPEAIGTPQVDKAGNLYIRMVNNDEQLIFKNQDGKKLFYVGPVLEIMRFLYTAPFLGENPKMHQRHMRAVALQSMDARLTKKGELMVFFYSSSSFLLIKNNKVEKSVDLWPANALELHKIRLKSIMAEYKEGYRTLFHNLFLDGDNEGSFFLQLGRENHTKTNLLYQFDLSGKLLKIYQIPFDENQSYRLFRAKQHNRFLAMQDEKIIIYKED